MPDIRASIIIPTHNSENCITRSVLSCLKQTERHIEVIVVDNGSAITDQTKKVLFNMKDDRIIYHRIDQSNRSLARNFGLKCAKGKYIQFLDADDELDSDKIKLSCNFLDKHISYFAYMTLIEYETEDKVHIRTTKKLEKNLTAHNTIPINAIVMRNKNLIRFDVNIVRCEDWLFWVENLIKKSIYFDNKYIGGYVVVSDNNTMHNRKTMLISEIKVRKIIRKKFKLKTFTILNLKYAIFGFVQLFSKGEQGPEIDTLIKENVFLSILAKILLRTPVLSKKLNDKVDSIRKINPY